MRAHPLRLAFDDEAAPQSLWHYCDDSPRLEAGNFLGSNTLALSSQGRMQDIQRGILVPITHSSTLLTAIDSYRQRHALPMPTVMAGLRGVCRGNFDHCSLSFFRFSEQCLEERRPCCIRYTFVEPCLLACPVGQIRACCLLLFRLWAFHHGAHYQGFYRNQPETVHQSSRLLLHKVLSAPAHTLMHAGHHLAPLRPLRGAALCPGQLTLRFREGLLFLAKEVGVLNVLTCRQVGKGFEAHINADLSLAGGQFRWGNLIAGKAHEPFACRTAGDRARLDDAFEGPVLHHLDMPNLGEGELALLINAKSRLRVGKAVIAEPGLVAGMTRLLTCLAPSEEGFERFVHPMQHILQHL